jgi:pyruvate ferredoxin oxidoreductase beta subunit
MAEMIRGMPVEEYFASGHRACAGCGAAIIMRHVTKAAGPNTVIVHATGCMEVVSTPYPETAWRLPWIHGAFENAPAIASGVSEALKLMGKEEVCVLVLGGDGSTFDIGFGALSGAIERGHNFCYVCYDNGAYMNTGIQRSGATPKYAATTTSPAGKVIPGKLEQKKALPFIVAAHGAPYVATASVADIPDLYRKVRKGLEIEGPTYVQVYAPCPVGWYAPPNKSIEIARLAIETRIWPMFEIERGKLMLRDVKNPKPVEEYLKLQGRFKHLLPAHVAEIQKMVDERWERLKRMAECGEIF